MKRSLLNNEHQPVRRPASEGAKPMVSYKGHVLRPGNGLWGCVHCGRTCESLIELVTCKR